MNWKTAVSQIERLATAKGRSKEKQYSIEGIRLLERALRAEKRPDFVIISSAQLQILSARLTTIINEIEQLEIQLIPVPDEEMIRLTNGRSLGGVMAVLPFQKPIEFSQWLKHRDDGLLLTAVDIIDPGNVGAMIRTAHASGVDGFISVGVSDPFHPKAIRTSMGSLFRMPTFHFERIDLLIALLKTWDFKLIGADLEGKRPLQMAELDLSKIVLFMGNEYQGLSTEITKHLNQSVFIPMPTGVDSFSVNAATAVFLYEINRQNWNKKG